MHWTECTIIYLWQDEKSNENWNALPPLWRTLAIGESCLNLAKKHFYLTLWKDPQGHFKEGKASENIFSPGKNLVAWKLPKKCLKYTYFYFKWIKHIFSLSKAFIGPFPEKSAKSEENYLKPIWKIF